MLEIKSTVTKVNIAFDRLISSSNMAKESVNLMTG